MTQLAKSIVILPTTRRLPKAPAKLQRSWYFKANDRRQYPYIDTSSLLSRKFPEMPHDTKQIMAFLCRYLNRKQALGLYVILASFFTATDDIKKLSRLSMQKRMQKAFKKFFGEDRAFDVGDISKLTNLLDALGLLAKKYCAINGEKFANRYMLNPTLRDPVFRNQLLNLLISSFLGKSEFKFAKRLNKRYSTFGSYKKTIMSIWTGVRDSFIGLTPTHELSKTVHNKSKTKATENAPSCIASDAEIWDDLLSASDFNGALDFWEAAESDNGESVVKRGVPPLNEMQRAYRDNRDVKVKLLMMTAFSNCNSFINNYRIPTKEEYEDLDAIFSGISACKRGSLA